jgi:Tfp pilus assembly protein PilN
VIRVNLAKGMPVGNVSSGMPGEIIDSGSAEIRREGGIRFLILLIVPLAMFGWESHLLPDLHSQLASKNKYFQSLMDKNEKAKNAVDEIKKFNEDQARLQKQIDILEGLQKERLLEVKILDNIQKDIPNKVWLNRIELQEAKLVVVGQTTTDSELTLFMENLAKSIFLKDVNLIKSEEFPSDKGTLKRFDILCGIDKPVAGVKK